jgi:uncharacterized protein YprB with RNaseH-like and TPR domain
MRVENSFVPVRGVGEKTERRLWSDGITDWEAFEESGVLGETRRERVLRFIEEARDALDERDAGFLGEALPDGEMWRMYRNFEDGVCFFDIETTGLDAERNKVTTVSFHRDGDTTTLVRGDDLTPGNVAEEFGESDVVVSYNGRRFDEPFLETDLGISVDTPHIDLMYLCRRIGLTGGLKSVEGALGVGREGVEEVDGREAVRLWHAYEDGDTEALERLVRYNRYDAENLRAVLEAVHDRLRDEVFVSALDA